MSVGARAVLYACMIGAVLALAVPARAQLAIAAPSCSDLALPEIERVLSLEIADVAAEWRALSSPVVLLGCADGRVRIEITDPVTDKSVARTVPMPELDRERVLGLAIAQLFLTSWLELLLSPDAPHDGPGAEAAERIALAAVQDALPDAEPEPQPDTEPEPEPVPEPEPEPEPEPVRRPEPSLPLALELSLDGGARWRSEGENLGTALGALRALAVVDRSLLVGARVALEWAHAARTNGTIELWQGALGLTVGWRAVAIGAFELDVSAIVSAVLVSLRGHPYAPELEGGSTIAIAGEAALELAPALVVGPLRIALPLALGGVAFAPPGEVTGEPPVITNGLVLSAALRAGLVL